jgi:GT2 family glycosyltransferase
MNISVIVVSNNKEVLESTLLASPDLKGGIEIVIEKDAISAAAGYNSGIKKSKGDILVFVHQDCYLPEGWFARLLQAIDYLNVEEPRWAVLGVYGNRSDGTSYGHLYSTGLRCVLGAPLKHPIRIQALDEVVLVLCRATGLCFDERLPGFHLYGADICLEANQHGFSCHVINAFCIHNSRGIAMLPWAYWQAWLYMRRKWWHHLPIVTPTLRVTRWGGAVIRYLIQSLIIRPYWLPTQQRHIGQRTSDSESLWNQLCLEAQLVPPSQHNNKSD